MSGCHDHATSLAWCANCDANDRALRRARVQLLCETIAAFEHGRDHQAHACAVGVVRACAEVIRASGRR